MDFGTWLDWRSSRRRDERRSGLAALQRRLATTSGSTASWPGALAVATRRSATGSTNIAVSWGAPTGVLERQPPEHERQLRHEHRRSSGRTPSIRTRRSRRSRRRRRYQTKYGPASISTRRARANNTRDATRSIRALPTISFTSTPITLGSVAELDADASAYSRHDVLHMDQPGVGAFTLSVDPLTGQRDSTLTTGRSSATSSMDFDMPFQIFGRDFKNSFRITQQRQQFPAAVQHLRPRDRRRHRDARLCGDVPDGRSTGRPTSRCRRSAHNKFNLTPSVSLQNVDPGPFWVATERTNGHFVHQTQALRDRSVGARRRSSACFRGFGPFERVPPLDHAIDRLHLGRRTADVSDEYLLALGRTRHGYLSEPAAEHLNFRAQRKTSRPSFARRTTRSPDGTGRRSICSSINFDAAQLRLRAREGASTRSGRA